MNSTNRRDFIQWLALIAAGAMARPEQISAFERYYEANTPQVETGLISIDEIYIGGLAQASTPVVFMTTPHRLNLALNLFGGICRWVAQPDGKMVVTTEEFAWKFESHGTTLTRHMIKGHISYVDQKLRRHYRDLDAITGDLA